MSKWKKSPSPVILLLSLFLINCTTSGTTDEVNHRDEMRDFISALSTHAKADNPDFIIIPQNGIELVADRTGDGFSLHQEYLEAIDGNGQEDLFFGYVEDDQATPETERLYLQDYLEISQEAGNTILVTDYCSTPSKVDQSYENNMLNGWLSFAADSRELDSIPNYPQPIFSENREGIEGLREAENFLYLINPGLFGTKQEFISAVRDTSYDILIMDLFFNDNTAFTAAEVEALRLKAGGGRRLIIAYLSIGEAETYRYYWNDEWYTSPPSWMAEENPDWPGNFKVQYWDPEWQNVILGPEDSYLDRILNAGFDGVYLDIIDAYEYFE